MEFLLITLFIGGYALIALEHRLHIDKAATAVLIGTLSWLILLIMPTPFHGGTPHIENALFHHLTEAAGILFFLLGAMTIVEVVDSYDGFQYVLRILRVKSIGIFLALLITLTFFLSAVIDNLTTTLLMVSLLQKVTPPAQRSVRLLGASLIVLAANSGGAWSPLGDVTTTMLWIKERITELNIVKRTLLPSIASVIIPYFIIVRQLRNTSFCLEEAANSSSEAIPPRISLAVFLIGIGGILSVPIMKIIFHIPPFLAMLFALGLVWIVTEVFYRRLSSSVEEPVKLRITTALERIDTPSLLFFLGILLAIGALSEIGVLRWVAYALDQSIGNMDVVVFLLGILSSVVDNVPLVAAAIEMYPLSQFPTDHHLWEFLAYTAGVGGNILIIGSAAGVVAMGMEKIEFFWYLRRISWIAFLGYATGAIVYVLLA
ncbi:MAG: sodium:proton antiporter NhaD [Bacteroidia bacterium]|nr:sodium:proton antiporter NhaD [Bacteroidia bacterium]MDW8235254.1 sodium:proton antiporter NhaD [Bacteroidia bacterium]